MKEIDRIDLTTNTIAAGNKVGELTPANDSHVEIEDYSWFGSFDGDVFTTEEIDVFEENMHVFLQAVFVAEDGYALTNDVEIYVNGQKAGMVRYMSLGYYGMFGMELGKVGQQEQVRTEKLTAPMVTVAEQVLSWAAVADADSYEIYRSTKKSSGFKKIDTITETEYFDQGATAGKTYYYKVKAIYNADTKLNSADSSVVSVDYKIPTPVISARADSATGKTVVSWGKVSAAKSYDVYRAVGDVDGKYTKIGNTKSTSFTDTKAELGAECYYKVVAVASKSKYNSSYSGIYMCYSYLARPDAKITVDEASGKPVLSWKKVSDAIGYRILRKLNGAAEYEAIAEITALTYKDTTAPLDSVCEYRVVALHENEYLNSAYSVEQKATVTFGRPVIKGSNNEEGKIVLSWNEIDGAVSYEVLRSTSSSKGFKVIATVTEGTTYTDTDAEGGKTYYYQVVAAGENTKSKASAAVKLTGTCAAPEIIIGRNPATGKLVVEWEKVSGAKSYEVYRATSADGKYTKIGTSKTTSYVDTKSEVGKTYYYKVLAVGSKKAYNSVFSNVESWSAVLARPEVKVTIDEASGKPELSWKKISGAVGYRIIRSLYDWGDAVELIDVTGTSFTDTTAPLDSNCSYAVIALYGDEQFNSVESNVVKATVTFGRPVIKGSINADGQPALAWDAIDGAQKYEVLRSTKSNKGFAVIATVETTEYTDAEAVAGKTYYYQVVAVGENTKSKASAYVKLTPTCAVPQVSIEIDGASGKPKLSWEKVNGAKSYDIYYATSANGKYKKLANTKSLTYIDTKVAVGATRFYQVRAVGSKSAYNSPFSQTFSARSVYAAPKLEGYTGDVYGDPQLKWKEIARGVYYNVYRRVEGEEEFTFVRKTNTYALRDGSAPLNQWCYYKVQTVTDDESLNSAWSNEVAVYSAMSQPIVDALNKDDGTPYLKWNGVEGAVKYEIYRSTKEKSGYELVGTTTGGYFEDTDAVRGKTYYYKVSAIAENGSSTQCAPQTIHATLSKPNADAEEDPVSGKPVITWEKVEGAKKYEIWRSTNDGAYKKLTTTTKLTYTDTSAAVGNTYSYQVRALASKSSYNSAKDTTGTCFVNCAQPQVTVKTDSKGMPVVSWKKVSGASKYYVLYVDVSDYWYNEDIDDAAFEEYIRENLQYEEVSSKQTSITLKDAQLGRLYLVYVMAANKNATFNSPLSEGQIIDRCCAAPKIKVDMLEGYNGATWNPVDGAEFYIVYRSTKKSSGYVELGSVEGNGFVDTSAVKGKTYYYKVAACTMHSEDTFVTISEYSNVIKIKTKK